ncbi:MAG: multidrug ABC transporter permease [Elusimicrobia bacterium RIFOXYA12_FULL_51_18]|nr:MAG: multidrug ABC transporter permease [Elusimicrobia bacterium RIFOXYA12_FULL_51_18]OGS28674.1 MAG: multidrug ABC transporter permease [Elusimicrobia bacterium RIFOXYA2_FULL_53_38]
MFNIHRAYSIARKEVMHILRDPFTLGLALGLPVMLVAFFGVVIDFEVKNIGMVSADYDNGPAARRLREIFLSSGFFREISSHLGSTPLEAVDSGRAAAVLYIPPDFSRDLRGGKQVSAQFVVDGSDNSKGAAILGYLPGIQQAAIKKITGGAQAQGWEIKTRFLYNPELNSRWFTIPGLAVMVIGLLSILLTALTVAREWENGSMEMLLATPVRPLEIMAGKIAPYAAIVLAGVFLIYLVARLGFGVPFAGSHLLFLLACLLFIVAALSQGLLISVLTRQQQVAMQFSMVTGLLPSLLLSGFIFPVESMPVFFRYFTMMLAPRWFMEAARGIFLKGAGLAELAVPFAALGSIAFILLAVAVAKFKTDVEP